MSTWLQAFLICVYMKRSIAAFNCPDKMYSVSVLDQLQVYCIPNPPCSGVYPIASIGMCPQMANCGLLPLSANVMGCIASGRADITYVRPDGTLFTTKNDSQVTGSNGSGVSQMNGRDALTSTEDQSQKTGNKSTADKDSPTDSSLQNEDTTVKEVITRASSASKLMESNTSDSKKPTSKFTNMQMVIVVVVCSLATIAFVAGVRLLKNNKEIKAAAIAAEEQYENIGVSCMTPKDEVVLL